MRGVGTHSGRIKPPSYENQTTQHFSYLNRIRPLKREPVNRCHVNPSSVRYFSRWTLGATRAVLTLRSLWTLGATRTLGAARTILTLRSLWTHGATRTILTLRSLCTLGATRTNLTVRSLWTHGATRPARSLR